MTDADADQPASGRPPLMVFVHIPKTAGTTMRTVLNMNEPGSRSRSVANVFKGGGGVQRGSTSERLRKTNLDDVGLIRGHVPLGVREYLPADRDLRCFTFLREPTDRTLSHYFAIRSQPGSDPTLDDMLEGGYVHDNLHTRMLSGLAEPFGEVDEEMLEAAKRNLREELVFFGLTERFDESLVLAKQRLGFRTILYRSTARVNTERPRGDEVPKQLRQAAERANSYDIELYRYATELFEEAPERGELEFEVELAALRAAKAEGEIEPDGKMPAGFGGGEKAWRMLVEATARSQRLDWEHKRHRIPYVSATERDENRKRELKAARLRAKRLAKEVERNKAASSKVRRLEKEVERLKAASSKAKQLEQEIERLKAASSGTKQLEREVERLKAASSKKTEELKRRGDRLRDLRSRKNKLEEKVERLKAAKPPANG